MTLLRRPPVPKTPAKAKTLALGREGQGFRLFRLSRNRGQRRTAPRTSPRAGGLSAVADAPPDTVPTLPGVPPEWCRGVALLASRPAPDAIHPRRRAILAATSAELLRDHGAVLQAEAQQWGEEF